MSSIQAQPWQESFSTREIEVLQLISEGGSNRDIAKKLHLSIETVKWYNKQMFLKLDVKNRVQLINKAAELNLLESVRDVPTLKEATAIGNLPAQTTSFIGRRKEIQDIIDLIQNNRLVVLTGTGGSGKTRLALKVGETIKNSYRDGVWVVELANIQDPTLVSQTISKSLGIKESSALTLEDALKRFLSKKHILLILNNLEHLLACGPFIGELLARSPRLSILGTSRERLHVYGEQEYPVNPLKLPINTHQSLSDEFHKIEAIDLFIQRARNTKPNFTVNSESKSKDLARICTLLDGLPLAIELCAPLVNTFSLADIAERIDKSLDAIPRGPKNLHHRQQTIRATIEWSYGLLDSTEKRVFIRMAVFNGSVPLKIVKAICGDGIIRDIGSVLFSLVNKNLIQAHERKDGDIHFHQLETIRKFGGDKLVETGKLNQYADRHADYFFILAKQANDKLRGSDQILWTNRMIALQDNFRSALEWVIEKEDKKTAVQFAEYLFEFWLRHADFEEAKYWMERISAMPNIQNHPELYLKVLNPLAWILWFQSKTEKGISLAEHALAMARPQPDSISKVVALLNLGLMLVHQNEGIREGWGLIAEASEISQDIDAKWEYARSLMALAFVHLRVNDYNRALSFYLDSYKLYKQIGDINFQGVVRRLIGDLELRRNNVPEAVEAYLEAVDISQEVDNILQTAYCFIGLSNAAATEGNHSDALKYHLAGKAILENVGIWSSGYEVEWEKKLHSAHKFLDPRLVESILASGRKMSNEEAIEYALEAVRASDW